jgi:hypothetical protein
MCPWASTGMRSDTAAVKPAETVKTTRGFI